MSDTTANLTTFKYAATPGAGGTASTSLDGVLSVNVPDWVTAAVSTKHLGSTIGTYIPAVPEPGTCTVTFKYSASLYNTVAGLYALRTFEIGFPETTGTYTFDGFSTRLTLPFEDVDGLVKCTWEIQQTGAGTIVAGS